jgi:thioredoxin-related protein
MKKQFRKSSKHYSLKLLRLPAGFGKVSLSIIVFTLFSTSVVGQLAKRGPIKPTTQHLNGNTAIKWMTMEQAYKASKVIDKPLFIDVYTSWCGWCKRMDQTTFQDPTVASYINANFHPVKFDAETNDTIQFLERPYWNSQTAYVKKVIGQSDSTIKVLNDSIKLLGNDDKHANLVKLLNQRLQQTAAAKNKIVRQGKRTTHDLAREVMGGKMSYPTFVLLFDSLKNNFPIKGYQKPEQLLSILSFFGEKLYAKTNDLAGYQKLFFSSFSSSQGAIKELSDFESTTKRATLSKKKTLILLTNDQLYSSQVLERGCVNDPEVRTYLNENFELGKLSLYENDSINFNGQVFKSVNGVHQLAISLLQSQVKFPAMVFLDENQKVIMSIPEFFLPADLVPIFHFIAEEAYKVGDYGAFRKKYEKNKSQSSTVGQ